MKNKIKYLIIGIVLGIMFTACDDSGLKADEEEFGEIGTVEWNPLYVYIVNE